ncbi:hypothetical protein jhhlp_000332 [Neofusicoccum parvum]|uniref:Uncharacterized protein n=1 Tax=Neofusicoccum parvum TaxID=310453 RepID=A0ACB5S4M0_9PEZI|nr:hypothetical protein jhhlp_000332 [Neofusicoccum parvum]
MKRTILCLIGLPSLVFASLQSLPETTALPALEDSTFKNPVIYEDFADNDIFRGPDGAYYFSASNMHYSPGAPVLRSNDMVNWEFLGHSVPTLSFSEAYNMTDGQTAYVGGTWASTMRYRESNQLWYWYGCIGFSHTHVYTASDPAGPWQKAGEIDHCYYDCGLHIDDDDTMYIVSGNTDINMAQLSADGFSEDRLQAAFSAPDGYSGTEGNRLYKRNGVYYVLNDHPPSTTFIWKSDSVWGPWEYRVLAEGVSSPVAGGGIPHQGSLVETPDGSWYFMSFTWAYPAGRLPVLAPITWGSDGFPTLDTVDGAWGAEYPMPVTANPPAWSWTGSDTFDGTSLGVDWEWNHNPDESGYAVDNRLVLSTVTVTDDLFHARNTLTHRVHGEQPTATIEVDFANMADGDIFGLAAFRDNTTWIGVMRSGDVYSVNVKTRLEQDPGNSWATLSTGDVVAAVDVSGTKIWLRGTLDARASGSKLVQFAYSTDGSAFAALGDSYALNADWKYFIGYRWGIFNYATRALGGSIAVLSFGQT